MANTSDSLNSKNNMLTLKEKDVYELLCKLSDFGVVKRPNFNFLGGFAGKAIRQVLVGSFARYYLNRMASFKNNFHYLEVGSWLGASLYTVADAIKKSDVNKVFTCIDFWQPYPSKEVVPSNEKANQMQSLLVAEMALPIFLNNIKSAVDEKNLNIIRKLSDEALNDVDESSVDLIFVDGSHYYDHVISDLKRSYKILKPGGVMLLDDYESRYANVVNWEDIAEQDFVENPANSVMFHPGVTRAVKTFCEEKSVPEKNVGQIGGLGIILKSETGDSRLQEVNLDIFAASHLPSDWLQLSIDDLANYVNGSDYIFDNDSMVLKFKLQEI